MRLLTKNVRPTAHTACIRISDNRRLHRDNLRLLEKLKNICISREKLR